MGDYESLEDYRVGIEQQGQDLVLTLRTDEEVTLPIKDFMDGEYWALSRTDTGLKLTLYNREMPK